MFFAALVSTGAFLINQTVSENAHTKFVNGKINYRLGKCRGQGKFFQINAATNAINLSAEFKELRFGSKLQDKIFHCWIRFRQT